MINSSEDRWNRQRHDVSFYRERTALECCLGCAKAVAEVFDGRET